MVNFYMPLNQLSNNEDAIITSSSHTLSELGFTKGTKIQMIQQMQKCCIIKMKGMTWAIRADIEVDKL